MRVLHVDSAAGWRGGQNQVLLTAGIMAQWGHEVRLICQEGGALEQRGRDAGLRVDSVRFHGDLSPGAALALARLVGDWRPDVLQLHDPHATAAGVVAVRLAGRGSGAHTVATRRVDFPLRSRWSQWKYRETDRIVVVSRAIGSVLEADGIAPGRLRLVHEGVRDRPPEPGGTEALEQLGVPTGAPVVGNIAALTDHKDHQTLIEAAALVTRHLPDVRFVIVGEGELRERLQERVRQLGLGERCLFAGFRRDLDCLLPSFTVFCLSSHLEGLGTSLLDAMCFSRPVVATAAGGMPEAVADGATGRVVPVRNPDMLAEALLDLLSDTERREAMGRAGRRRFEKCFTAEQMARNTLCVYQELTGLDGEATPGAS